MYGVNFEIIKFSRALHKDEVVHIVLIFSFFLRLYILYKSKDSNNNFVNIAALFLRGKQVKTSIVSGCVNTFSYFVGLNFIKSSFER